MSQPWAGNLIRAVADSEMQQDLTLREAVAEDRLDDFVRQEEDRGVELATGSELERALALLITKRWVLVGPLRPTLSGLSFTRHRRVSSFLPVTGFCGNLPNAQSSRRSRRCGTNTLTSAKKLYSKMF